IANTRVGKGEPLGFGGWLFLLGLNVLLLPFALTVGVYQVWRVLFSLERWLLLVTPELPTYRPRLAVLLVAGGIAQIRFLAYSVTVATAWLKKKRSFGWHFTILMVCLAGGSLLDHISMSLLSSQVAGDTHSIGSTARMIVFAMIWVPYVHRS